MILLALNKEYDKLDAWTIFTDWFKTVLLPKEVTNDFEPRPADPMISTAIPVNTSSLSDLTKSPTTNFTSAFVSALEQLGIRTNYQP